MYQVLCPETAFIGIIKQKNKNSEDMVKINLSKAHKE